MHCLGLAADLSLDPARTTYPIPHLARAIRNLGRHRADFGEQRRDCGKPIPQTKIGSNCSFHPFFWTAVPASGADAAARWRWPFPGPETGPGALQLSARMRSAGLS